MRVAVPPRLLRHRAKDLAYVRINARQKDLGRWDSPQLSAKYDRICRDWRAAQGAARYALSVADITMRYQDHAAAYYRKGGAATSEVQVITDALRPLNDLFRTLRAADIRPRQLKEYQQELIRRGWARTTINTAVGQVRRMLSWAVAEELLPVDVLTVIETFSPLKKGRSSARETRNVMALPDALIDAVLPHVSPVIRGLIEFQRFTGARPSKARLLRLCDVTTHGDVWEYRPVPHKTEHHDKQRVIMIGKKAQAVLRKFATTDLRSYLFFPDGSADARPYERTANSNAVFRACELAYDMPSELRNIRQALKGVPEDNRPVAKNWIRHQARDWRREHCWSPNAIRHSFGTAARRMLGIDAARTALGHATLTATQIHAEQNIEAARGVAARIG